jgi:hypothetical protein
MEKIKKKFKDTKVGKFLASNGSSIVDTLGDVLPDAGILGMVANLINKLSKNVRPLTLIFMTISLITFIFLDSTFQDFDFEEVHIETLKQLCSVVFIAYFGGRSYEKTRK